MSYHQRVYIVIVFLFIMVSALYVIKKQDNASVSLMIPSEQNIKQQIFISEKHTPYTAKEFSLVMGPKKFSNKQINDHKKLYFGYINKRNEIYDELQKVDRAQANNVSYSTFRGLKLAETFTRNAALLHELYFENIGAGTQMGEKTKDIILQNFGSISVFKEDLMATAASARGWALTCYNLDDQTVQNYLLDTHNDKVPVLTIPLLVIDAYEHAYMIDFGINRKEYLDILWDNINWDIIEQRVRKWIFQDLFLNT